MTALKQRSALELRSALEDRSALELMSAFELWSAFYNPVHSWFKGEKTKNTTQIFPLIGLRPVARHIYAWSLCSHALKHLLPASLTTFAHISGISRVRSLNKLPLKRAPPKRQPRDRMRIRPKGLQPDFQPNTSEFRTSFLSDSEFDAAPPTVATYECPSFVDLRFAL